MWVLLDNAFNIVYDGRSTVWQDGNKVAHKADKDLLRDAVIYADPRDLLALKNIYGCVFRWRFEVIVIIVSTHWIPTHARPCRHLCIYYIPPNIRFPFKQF